MKKITNLIDFKNILPYASEAFGVYQPLLGWKSKRILDRVKKGFLTDKKNSLYEKFKGIYELNINQSRTLENIVFIKPGELFEARPNFGGIIWSSLKLALPPDPFNDEPIWDGLINSDHLNSILNSSVINEYQNLYNEHLSEYTERGQVELLNQLVEDKVKMESVTSGMLLYLKENKLYDRLREIFYKSELNTSNIEYIGRYTDPFEMFNMKDLDQVVLSPIGTVHLFRQYFYEFDTFLGSPVGHIWVSPGSSVELMEISTRKTITERSTESFTESIAKSEKSITEQDEIAEAVKTENKNETKFGASVTATESVSIKMFSGSSTQSLTYDTNTMQQAAREQTHKHMRQQSEKVSTEIRQNFKSTFKTVTEVTDTNSKRYVLSNNTAELINYELRRKMRQIGVQVQDIGTYLCWQTYVDDPGKQLGVAKLIHIAKAAELNNIAHPERIVPPSPINEDKVIPVYFNPTSDDDAEKDQGYTNGVGDDDDDDKIQYDFPQEVTCAQANYVLKSVTFTAEGAVDLRIPPIAPAAITNFSGNKAQFIIHLDYVNFKGNDQFNLKMRLAWDPVFDQKIIDDENNRRVTEFTAKQESTYKNEFIQAAKDRIKLASNIQIRNYEDLRGEERVVVYRILIQDMLMQGISVPDNRTRHVVAELINSIFDIDRMLYFVAPEWWKPKTHERQSFGSSKSAPFISSISHENIVGWGGLDEFGRDNYYITEDSVPAKLGSSLGWLLQLDGDNLRNAFLNAPWVKAVIPIRPGKEKAAINWLKQVEGMNGIGPADMYTGSEPEFLGKTIIEVLEILAEKVKKKHEDSIKVSIFPDPEAPIGDTTNSVSATPVDKVYEHGFYPLQGGFRADPLGKDFEVFDQWTEMLPTDQVVAVEVKYNPKTGRQI